MSWDRIAVSELADGLRQAEFQRPAYDPMHKHLRGI
jgi:hypothetical protein